MKRGGLLFPGIAILLFTGFVLNAFQPPKNLQQKLLFPYASQGLTDRQAAAHLLSRFTYGATPGQVDEVVKMGLEKWFQQQLDGGLPDDSLKLRLEGYDILKMTNTEIVNAFPKPLQVMRMAAAEGFISKDSIGLLNKDEYRRRMSEYIKAKNFRQQSDLIRQFINQRILRAAYSNNQLHEVLTGFWFNHFNVSLTKREDVLLMPAYERDAIRPYVTGKFEDMLLATAKSPAMLIYLDNFSSSGSNENTASVRAQKGIKALNSKDGASPDSIEEKLIKRLQLAEKNRGLNENYAREVMELHTMGVDGGYTQADVTQAARILTGWTLYPIAEGYSPFIKRLIDQAGEQRLLEKGFVHEGDFMFAANRHDNKEKKVLGKIFPANGGYKEGVELLKMLAHHPSTAKFIAKKLATYFVADNPVQSLVDKMAKTFLEKNGDIKEVLITMVNAPEFWNTNAIRSKTKSPFELAISAVRVLGADIELPYQLFTRMDKMGQKIYYFQAPTGFPDRAQYWINTGALLNRMNFGLDIASQQLRGVKTDLLKLNNYHEPESAAAALSTYAALLMPERNMDATIKRLLPLLTDPSLEKKVQEAANNASVKNKKDTIGEDEVVMEDSKEKSQEEKIKNRTALAGKNMLAQVVGIIIGSPEFQRR